MGNRQKGNRKGFEHDVGHHGEVLTPFHAVCFPQFLPGSFSAWAALAQDLWCLTALRLDCLARQKNLSGQIISYEINGL